MPTLVQRVGELATRVAGEFNALRLLLGKSPAITVGANVDQAPAINAALADANTTKVILPAGVIWVEQTVKVPSGKQLVGQGAGKTILRALPSFNRAAFQPWIIGTTEGATDILVSDLEWDCNKVGLGLGDALRLHGFGLFSAQNFTVERCRARNVTGYGVFAMSNDLSPLPASGVVRDCEGINCGVHFEATRARGVLFERCTWKAGDGDVSCEAFIHALNGSSKITFRDCSGDAMACTGGLLIIRNTAEPVTDIVAENCRVEVSSGIALNIDNGQTNAGLTGVRIDNCLFDSPTYVGAQLKKGSGRISNSRMLGRSFGALISANTDRPADWEFVGCEIVGRNTFNNATVYGLSVESGATAQVQGGAVIAASTMGGSLSPVSQSGNGIANISPTTRLTPFGGGAQFRQMLRNGNASAVLSAQVVGSGYSLPWTWYMEAGRSYEIEINGQWIHGANAALGRVGLKGDGTLAGTVRGFITLGTSATAQTTGGISGLGGVASAGSYVEAADAASSIFKEVTGRIAVLCTTSGWASIEIVSATSGQSMQLAQLSRLTVREV